VLGRKQKNERELCLSTDLEAIFESVPERRCSLGLTEKPCIDLLEKSHVVTLLYCDAVQKDSSPVVNESH